MKEGKLLLSLHFVNLIYRKFYNEEMHDINKDINFAHLDNDSCFWKIENIMQALHFNKKGFYMNILLLDKSVFIKKLLTSFD